MTSSFPGKYRHDASELNEDAVRAWMEGREEEAIELAGRALEADPSSAFAKINLHYFQTTRNIRETDIEKKRNRTIEKTWESNPPSSPEISVILPTYRRPDMLKEALKSVLSQTFEDFEVVVVNDGGPPDAEEICKRAQDNRVRYILRNHSGVSAGALNAGLQTARGRYVAYLDDDDLYKPHHLETLVDAARSWGKEGVLYTDSEKIKGRRTPEGWQWSRPEPFFLQDFDPVKLRRQNFIEYQCVLHPKDMVLNSGGFNEGLNYCVNWELWLRLSKRYPFRRIPKVTVVEREPDNAPRMGLRPVGKRQSSRNSILYMHRIFAMSESGISKSARLAKVLGKLFEKKPEIIDILDLRELVTDKPYAMLYKLGKELAMLGDKTTARRAYLGAVRLAPWEIKSYPKLLSPPKPER